MAEAVNGLELVADGGCQIATPRTLDKGNAIDLPTIEKLGRERGRKFLKAMQCLNIARPLGHWMGELSESLVRQRVKRLSAG